MRPNVPSQSADCRISNCRLIFSLCCCTVLFASLVITGCSSLFSSNAARDRQIYAIEELSEPYKQITLKKSLTLDAIPKIRRSRSQAGSILAETETVSHSDRVVASLGQSTDGYITWFNMVRFGEYRLNVIHKSFFAVEDKHGSLMKGPRRGLCFNCEMVLSKGALGQSYVSENERRIGILRYVLDGIREDIQELGDDEDVPGQYNKKLDVCVMLINQTLELILVKLNSSPVLAAKLSSAEGFDFDHINFGRGNIKMIISDDIVEVEARFGAFMDIKAQ